MTHSSQANVARGLRRDRAWLRVAGPDAQRFLNGMWTCDFKRLSSSAPACAAAYLLDAKGKALAFALAVARSPDDFVIGVERPWVARVRETLERFLVADDVTIEEDTAFAQAWELPTSALVPAASTLRVSSPVPGASDAVFRVGVETWGWRLPRVLLGQGHEEVWVLSGASLAMQEIPRPEWDALRVQHGVPEWGRDVVEDALILEFPFSEAVSFHKGCYIGQEVVARATSRGKMNRAFARFGSAPGSALVEGYVHSMLDAERPVGKITTVVGSEGLGLIRLSAISAELYQDQAGVRVSLKAQLVEPIAE